MGLAKDTLLRTYSRRSLDSDDTEYHPPHGSRPAHKRHKATGVYGQERERNSQQGPLSPERVLAGAVRASIQGVDEATSAAAELASVAAQASRKTHRNQSCLNEVSTPDKLPPNLSCSRYEKLPRGLARTRIPLAQ